MIFHTFVLVSNSRSGIWLLGQSYIFILSLLE